MSVAGPTSALAGGPLLERDRELGALVELLDQPGEARRASSWSRAPRG